MNKYSVTFSVSGYCFKIITHDYQLLENQKRYIKKFGVQELQEDSKQELAAVIQYIENTDFFNVLREKFNTHDTEIVQSNKGIFHLRYMENARVYFCQLDNDWILIQNSGKSYVVVGNGIDDSTLYPFRLVREILIRKQEERGKLFMNATGVTVDGKGIVIFEDKNDGKNTFLTTSLGMGNAQILSNNRIFIYKSQTDFCMDYFPIPVVYRIKGIKRNRLLKRYVLEHTDYSKTECMWNEEDIIPIPLSDIPSIFNDVSLVEKANIDALIFSKANPNWTEKYECKKLSQLDKTKFLLDTCFTPIDYETKRRQWVYFRKISDEQIADNVNSLIKEMAKKIPAYYVEYGKYVDIEKLLIDIITDN